MEAQPRLPRAGWISILLLEELRNAVQPPGSHGLTGVTPCCTKAARCAATLIFGGWPISASATAAAARLPTILPASPTCRLRQQHLNERRAF